MFLKIVSVIAASGLLFFFNNCGQKFQGAGSASSSSEVAALSTIDHGLVPVQTTLTAFKNSSQVADNLPLAVNTAYQFQIVGDNLRPLTANWTSNCTIAGADLLSRTITCASAGTINVSVALTFSNAEAVTKTFSRQVTATEVTTPPTNMVTFNILAGTGNGKWNQLATPVVVFKGQTLRVMNQDSMVHRLHTGGNPCPHQGPDIANGQFYDCVVTQAHAANATDTYDHNVGTSSNFYIYAIDGAALYSQKFNVGGQQKGCVDCHGALATSAKKNRTFAQIKAAIAAGSGGMNAITLSDDQIRAIEYQLSR